MKLARACRAAGGKAGITISDPFCVERHRADFLNIIEQELDYVIGNEEEVKSLFETNDLDDAIAKLSAICPLAVCTRSGDGVSIMSGGERIDVPVTKVVPIDATGAGDQFAAGFLYGLSIDKPIGECGALGNLVASKIITHLGARPDINLEEFVEKAAY